MAPRPGGLKPKSAADIAFARKVGLRITATRQLRAMSEDELAGRLGLDPLAYQALEIGVRIPSTHLLMDLAAALGVTVPWLLQGKVEGLSTDFLNRLMEFLLDRVGPEFREG
jgi:transcriptional regulator with XRE-family HTH domain